MISREMNFSVGIIDKDPKEVDFLEETLNRVGVAKTTKGTNAAVVTNFLYNPDLLILTEASTVADVRQIDLRIPIMCINQSSDDYEIEQVLWAGADTYFVKKDPFRDLELAARLSALHRRATKYSIPQSEPEPELGILHNGDVTVNCDQRLVTLAGRRVPLTKTEYVLFLELMKSPGKAVPSRTLLSRHWGQADKGVLRVNIKRIRDKLGEPGSRNQYISNIPGVGYMMLPQADVVDKAVALT
jgi:DNA-binding response OmpR family regulator